MRFIASCLVAASAFVLPGLAHADITPEGPDHCTLQEQQRPGEQCAMCSASYEAPNKCQTELGGRGLSQRCRSQGASVWHEVWCPGGAAPPPAEKKGCSACAVGTDSNDGLFWAVLAASVIGAGAAVRRVSSNNRDRTPRQ